MSVLVACGNVPFAWFRLSESIAYGERRKRYDGYYVTIYYHCVHAYGATQIVAVFQPEVQA